MPALAAENVLQRHTVMVDGHPISVHGKRPARPRAAVLLVHGRTWSGLPDFDLQVSGAQVSLMDALVAAEVAVYAVDLRGYGATPRDATGFATPKQSAVDVAAVLRFVQADAGVAGPPFLLGWSMGALVSALTVGEHDPFVDSGCMADHFNQLHGVDRRWEILAGADHAAHLESASVHFVAAVVGFIRENGS